MFSVNTSSIYRQFFGAILVLGLVLSYTEYFEENRAEAIEIVGMFSIKKLTILKANLAKNNLFL